MFCSFELSGFLVASFGISFINDLLENAFSVPWSALFQFIFDICLRALRECGLLELYYLRKDQLFLTKSQKEYLKFDHLLGCWVKKLLIKNAERLSCCVK